MVQLQNRNCSATARLRRLLSEMNPARNSCKPDWKISSMFRSVRQACNARTCRSPGPVRPLVLRSEEHTSELQSLMRISYAVFCLKKKINKHKHTLQQSHQHTAA